MKLSLALVKTMKLWSSRPPGHAFPAHVLYQEFTRLAETRLAQNTLNYLAIASNTLK